MDTNNNFDNFIPEKQESFDYERFAAEEKLAQSNSEAELEKGNGKKRTNKSKDDKKEGGSDLYEWLQCLVSALLICVLVFAFFVRIIGIVGSSMVPTFHDGDSVAISNLFYEPKQGDIVVLRKLAFQEEPIIKRVIAVEGQTVNIDFDQGIVYVDDVALDEPYTAEPTVTALDFDGKITVPENCVFVMGDNRNNSTDSRRSVIGCVDTRYIMGKVLLRLLPINGFGVVK